MGWRLARLGWILLSDRFGSSEAELLALKQEVNKWTENIWAIKSYVVNNLGMQATEFDERFEWVSKDWSNLASAHHLPRQDRPRDGYYVDSLHNDHYAININIWNLREPILSNQ